ncbi:hypothetical protein FNV68_21890 [Streptomyces sp. S1D4-23]|nr:hypothetical protein FNV61_20805 [Streptomyces sp. RLB3-6]QDO08558.1 hypothetical protein FNV68_21890 [Streptomyces sp. S1D4-23]
MNRAQRVVLGATGLAVAILAGVFSSLSWDRANQVAGIVSALVSILALGAAVWALLSGGNGGSVRVANTGTATATGQGSRANTGIVASGGVRGNATVEQTADAQAEDGARANTGYEQP